MPYVCRMPYCPSSLLIGIVSVVVVDVMRCLLLPLSCSSSSSSCCRCCDPMFARLVAVLVAIVWPPVAIACLAQQLAHIRPPPRGSRSAPCPHPSAPAHLPRGPAHLPRGLQSELARTTSERRRLFGECWRTACCHRYGRQLRRRSPQSCSMSIAWS